MVPRTLYASLPYGRPTVTDLRWLTAVPPTAYGLWQYAYGTSLQFRTIDLRNRKVTNRQCYTAALWQFQYRYYFCSQQVTLPVIRPYGNGGTRRPSPRSYTSLHA